MKRVGHTLARRARGIAIARASTLAIVCLVGLGVGGCSVLVDPDDKPLQCDPSVNPDPCPDGLVCRGNTCQEGTTRLDGGMADVPRIDGCEPDPRGELCNGSDDDCDGVIDEGHDVDMDGFYWCGDGTDPMSVDCDDNDRTVHPTAEELCDSIDNDCNGTIDESAGLSCARSGDICANGICRAPSDCRNPDQGCGTGFSCDTTHDPAECVMVVCSASSCPTGQVCDPVRGVCVSRVAFGAACTSDAECESNVCVDRAAGQLTMGPPSFCSMSCCADQDCPAASICWASGTGAKVCVPEATLGFTRGTKGGTETCSVGSECAAGICFTDGCMGNCGRDSDCSGSDCTLQPYTAGGARRSALMCDTLSGGGINSDCFNFGPDNRRCRSNACYQDSTVTAHCTIACRTSADCSGSFSACSYLTNGSFVQICVRPPSGSLGVGGTCDRNDQCREGACLGGTCAATCCADSDCGAGAFCKPRQIGAHWETHCLP